MTTRTRIEDPFVTPDAYVLEDEEGNPVETSQPTAALQPFQADNFAAKLARVKMLGTYKKCVEIDYGTHEIIGVLHPLVELTEKVEMIDERSGEVEEVEKPGRKYHQLKLKCKDGKVMMAAGRGAEKFWKDDLAGQLEFPDMLGDFPPGISITVKIAQETLKGKTAEGANRKWPVFTLV